VDLRERRELNNGFGEALSRAFEFAVTPVVFGFLGHLIDMRLNTSPIFLLALAAFAVVGMFVRLWYGYDQAMQAKEAGTPWGRSTSRNSSASTSSTSMGTGTANNTAHSSAANVTATTDVRKGVAE
jgi:F0F1-type ATP synthase assembly protein I